MSEFKVVQSKSRKHRKSIFKPKREESRDTSPSEIDVDKLLKQIENCEHDLLNSEFFTNSVELLSGALNHKQLQEVICLGIGRISECSIAKHQLAFISLIEKRLQIPVVKLYDPVLSKSEIEVLQRLGYEVLTDNKEGKYIAEHPTLFYLPHCPKQLKNNLLFTNWNPDNLQNLVLICNSFKSVIESTPERLLRPNAHYILEIDPLVIEKEIDNSFKFSDIFNDFSIHSFNSDSLKATPTNFWEIKPEPNYKEEDLELIRDGSN